MRIFNCRLDFSKLTERKFRWEEDIDGTPFELYIPQWRVPEPTPQTISVRIYDATTISSAKLLELGQRSTDRFTRSDMLVLEQIGLTAEHIRQVDTRRSAEGEYASRNDKPIVAAVAFDRPHTKTMRYLPFGERPEIGWPYIPKSELGEPHPQQLLLLVGWVD